MILYILYLGHHQPSRLCANKKKQHFLQDDPMPAHNTRLGKQLLLMVLSVRPLCRGWTLPFVTALNLGGSLLSSHLRHTLHNIVLTSISCITCPSNSFSLEHQTKQSFHPKKTSPSCHPSCNHVLTSTTTLNTMKTDPNYSISCTLNSFVLSHFFIHTWQNPNSGQVQLCTYSALVTVVMNMTGEKNTTMLTDLILNSELATLRGSLMLSDSR